MNEIELKRMALSSGAYSLFCQTRKNIYKSKDLEDRKRISQEWEDKFPTTKLYDRGKYETPWDMWTLCSHIYNSTKNKRLKCKSKIEAIIKSGNAYFLTLTFNDGTLERTDFNQRRRLVRDFLNETFEVYIANVDYGKTTEREHYHCVVGYKGKLTKEALKYWTQDNKKRKAIGFVDYPKKIGNKDSDLEKVSTYVAKLTNHSMKVSTLKNGGANMIYSKSSKDIKINKIDILNVLDDLASEE